MEGIHYGLSPLADHKWCCLLFSLETRNVYTKNNNLLKQELIRTRLKGLVLHRPSACIGLNFFNVSRSCHCLSCHLLKTKIKQSDNLSW